MRCWLIVLMVLMPVFAVGSEQKISIRGDWEQGGILFGRVMPKSTIKLNGKPVQVTSKGDFVLGLSRNAGKVADVIVVDNRGVQTHYKYPVKQREYDVQKIEGVQKKHVTPPKSFTDRIAREAALVKKARKRSDLREDFLQAFQWPLIGPITGVYGSQRVYNGVPKTPHYGIDIGAPTGAKVQAPAAGLITLAEKDLFYSGGTIILDHGYGLSSTFLHLSRVLVEVGQRVEQGQEIAEVGATGRATGPHLDWRMNWVGVRVDPGLLMRGTPMEKDY